MGLKRYIVDKSKELNIDMIGFTDCEPLNNKKDYLIARQKKNRQTEFEERDIDKRINPRLTFPQCKTIIVIGLSYNNRLNERVDYKLKGLISKSSWGIDYHIVLKSKMEDLIKEIRKITNFTYKYFVDTGPLIDRELANKSGIGYYGKNCSIINGEYGSFIFIGYILTDLDINFIPISIDSQCGDCNICIDHCPTGALEGPFKFNPKKCISYLTQTKEKIPYELRDKMEIKIYGCDTCQLVCPKNKDVKKSNCKEFLPKVTKGYMDIEELFFISNRQFKEKYGEMAGSWRGKNILKRNGIIALGNMRDRVNIKLLESLLNDPNPVIREYAAWAILKIDLECGKEVVEERIGIERDENVRSEMKNLIKYFIHKDYQ
ncbi:Epoxyqueuosine reductase [[Clostridium] ultunense Esp]|uniref:Epoxyqueuosine reductase n=1 Tax=[Clostridium] ultunense Esp TaxID=1288971 RepID=M1ZAI1_9FIRM|nr:tRNA epoxyqueuosine(34) reductase QueG [Schnuerera ultunensis]CCQ95256.1 Epoxyqueuosine reductase [[Clostridium] ultunense Esp]SHD75858.1 Epoxyqueuosine reductase [[Clostridium] ultunense Esp]